MATIKVITSGGFGVETVEIPGPFRSLDQMKEANRRKGGHFFGPSEMRFFRSRPAKTIEAGRFFIDSIQFVDSRGTVHPREYKIILVTDGGDTHTVMIPISQWDGSPLDNSVERDKRGREQFTSVREARRMLRLFLKTQGV